MPSLQTALPPELANNTLRYVGMAMNAKAVFSDAQMGRREKLTMLYAFLLLQKHNTQLLVDMVRQQFKKHKHETDPEKIQKLKDDAARGLINHILYESEQVTGSKFSKTKQPN
ncbi:hypothetical protein LR48_Vigan09g173400 [Vigna angularis]|uniref:Complex 1 LYR protein domain-containing protein n=1 Tax=Phaseolus angularis TaxID=3914 RepID=A0A0L9VDE3_PHAAN|nr:hypothetical protein LR48_Vigan09g173400 [Vigna angularis]